VRAPIGCFALVVAALAAAHLHADEGPLVQPQWIAAQTEDQLVYDRIAASVDPVTVAMPDGGEIVATVANDELVLRRYAADGSVGSARSVSIDLDGDPEIVVQPSTALDAFYVLAGGAQTPATLMRFDAALGLEWSVELPFESICEREGRCLRLALLGDDSVVAMRAYRVMRVGDDGEVRWSVTDPDAGSDFRAGDLAVGDTAIWIAATGGNDFYDPSATLARLDFDGARLSADVSSCHGCGGAFLNDIELTGDGGARAVGAIGGHGLYARYDALGFPLLQATSDTAAFVRLAHDANGAAYVLEDSFPDTVVHRIDPSSGQLSWSLPADDLVALDTGIAIIRNTSTTLEVSAVDAGGTPVWQRALTADSSLSYRVATHPAYVEGRVELLARDLAPSDDPCAIYPRFVRLDGAGEPTWFNRPCRTRPESALVWSIDAQPSTGVLVDTLAHLAMYSPNGDLRWRLHACEWCSDDSSPSAWAAAMLAQDGGAWAMRWDHPSLADPDGRTLIERYDALGDPVFAVESLVNGGSVGNYYDKIVIRPGVSDLVMLFVGGQTLYWQRVADDGSALTVRSHPVSDMFFSIEDARRLADGSTVVLTKGRTSCTVGCDPAYVTVLRIAQNGDLVARYEFPEADASWIPAALDIDGNAAGIVWDADSLRIRTIDADGSMHESDIAGIDSNHHRATGLASVSLGRWWLQVESSFESGDFTQALVDDMGSLLAERHDGAYAWLSQTTPFGVFVHAPDLAPQEHVALLDSITLAERIRFYVGTGEPTGPRNWSFAEDGSVYGTITLPQSGLQAVARYSVPGTSPSDVIFRNAFD